MAANVGTVDKIVRVSLGVAAAITAFVIGPATLPGIVLFVVAAIALVTALTGFCPLYRLLRINTCPARTQ